MNRTLRVLACFALTGCYTYQLAPLGSIKPSNQVRVTARDGRRVELYDVTIANDTLRGISIEQRSNRQPGRDTTAVAVADVTKVEVERVNAGKTAAVIGLPILAFVSIVALAIIAQGGPLGR